MKATAPSHVVPRLAILHLPIEVFQREIISSLVMVEMSVAPKLVWWIVCQTLVALGWAFFSVVVEFDLDINVSAALGLSAAASFCLSDASLCGWRYMYLCRWLQLCSLRWLGGSLFSRMINPWHVRYLALL